MLNKVMLIGNLGADPDVRRLNSGDSVVNLRIATTERWRDKSSGDRKERTEWHNVVIFNEGLVKVAEQYLKKGSKVYIEGKLQTRSWEKDGEKKYTTEVVLQNFNGTLVMLGDGNGEDGGSRGGGGGGGGRRDDRRDDRGRDSDNRGGGGSSSRQDLDDEIPF